jgi:hypothetical protein
MISEQQAEQLVYQHINRPWPAWPDKPEMIVIRVVERPLDWIVYWTSKADWENPDSDHVPTGNAPYLVSREDGTLFETGPASPIEDCILATEHKIQKHLLRKI